jgi:hypothetical protein
MAEKRKLRDRNSRVLPYFPHQSTVLNKFSHETFVTNKHGCLTLKILIIYM